MKKTILIAAVCAFSFIALTSSASALTQQEVKAKAEGKVAVTDSSKKTLIDTFCAEVQNGSLLARQLAAADTQYNNARNNTKDAKGSTNLGIVSRYEIKSEVVNAAARADRKQSLDEYQKHLLAASTNDTQRAAVKAYIAELSKAHTDFYAGYDKIVNNRNARVAKYIDSQFIATRDARKDAIKNILAAAKSSCDNPINKYLIVIENSERTKKGDVKRDIVKYRVMLWDETNTAKDKYMKLIPSTKAFKDNEAIKNIDKEALGARVQNEKTKKWEYKSGNIYDVSYKRNVAMMAAYNKAKSTTSMDLEFYTLSKEKGLPQVYIKDIFYGKLTSKNDSAVLKKQ